MPCTSCNSILPVEEGERVINDEKERKGKKGITRGGKENEKEERKTRKRRGRKNRGGEREKEQGKGTHQKTKVKNKW